MKPNPISQRFWELPELTHINRLPAHADLIPYAGSSEALAGDPESSSFCKSLDGPWDFKLFLRPEEACLDGSEGWDAISVPSNWTLGDFGDRPIYTNVQMPWKNNPPVVPNQNPTGVYRKVFALEESWLSRRTVIRFGGIESYAEIYLNNLFVGMTKDSRLPAEFDLSAFLVSGDNELVVKVLRWSDGSYIEDQDHWWMAGIHRSVCLYSTDHAYIEDLFARADWDLSRKDGLLNLDVKLGFSWEIGENQGYDGQSFTGPQEPYRLEVDLYPADGAAPVLSMAQEISPFYRRTHYSARWERRLPGAEPWSSEKPTLYRLVLVLKDHAGREMEARALKIGFRNLRLGDRELLINGKAVMIKGVNRHDHHPKTGKTVDRATMIKDIKLLKRFNFNAVRTSHYPNDSLWYELCDEYGLYVVDEANIEAHANYATLCRDPRWRRAFEDRVMNMVNRDKNHPCVISWSLGNETGNGDNHAAVAALVRAFDPSRVLHHEGDVKLHWHQRGNEYIRGCNTDNDLINPMYPPIDEIVRHAVEARDPRPVILSEYSHAMGNSNGSLKDYWEAFWNYQGLQGGFIWDWVDQGLTKTDENGVDYWAYGGDFGEAVHDFDFCINGMIWPDRTPHPAMFEFKKCAQSVAMKALSAAEGRYEVSNRQDFSNFDGWRLEWTVEVDGVAIDQGRADLPQTAPGSTGEIRVPHIMPVLSHGQEAFILFRFILESATPWCDAGHELAWEQFTLTPLVVFENLDDSSRSQEPVIEEEDPRVVLRCGKWYLEADEDSASLLRMEKEGWDVFASFPEINLWRAPTDNDAIRGWTGQEDKPANRWKAAGFDDLRLTDSSMAVVRGENPSLILERRYLGSDRGKPIVHRMIVGFDESGDLAIANRFDFAAGLEDLPRVGVEFRLPQGFEELEWFGKGPWENYVDRDSAPVGLYRSTVNEQFIPYILPQANGNKTAVRRLTFTQGDRRLTFSGFFEFSVGHYEAAELARCHHTNELRPVQETIVTLDLKQRGLGTASCGPDTLDRYRIPSGRYDFDFTIR